MQSKSSCPLSVFLSLSLSRIWFLSSSPMTRRCSHCSNNGHNSRTCPTTRGGGGGGGGGGSGGVGGGGGGGGVVKLFGVRLTDGSFMKKSKSMGNLSLSHYQSSATATASPNPSSPSSDHLRDGYLSDDPNHASCSSNRPTERKKGKPWTEEEHRLFLIGLQKLGKGDWRGIARTYVVSRTPTQVASHAQKYFIRQSNATRRKRRSSLFDMVPDMVTEEPQTVPEEQLLPPSTETKETDNTNSLLSTDLSLSRDAEPMEATSTEEPREARETMVLPSNLTPALPLPTLFLPFPYPQFWPHSGIQAQEHIKGDPPHHEIWKPTPVLRKEPVNVNELVGMSRLNLSDRENGHVVPPQLSLGLLGTPSRQSAFHVSAPAASSAELNEGKNSVIQAV